MVIDQTHVIGSQCREVSVHASTPYRFVVRFKNRQQAAGTRRVRQPERVRLPAGTGDTRRRADLQDKRARE